MIVKTSPMVAALLGSPAHVLDGVWHLPVLGLGQHDGEAAGDDGHG